MIAHSVVGVYESMTQAAEAVHTLDRAAFPVTQLSIVTQNLASDQTTHAYMTSGNDFSPHGGVMGAWLGGLVRLLVGAAFLWVPGFGPLLVVGRFADLLLVGVEGALAGAATGRVLGALTRWGIAEAHMLDYEHQVRTGKHLVIASGTTEEVEQAHAILQGTDAGALHVHARTRI